jgi:hypothetical protein
MGGQEAVEVEQMEARRGNKDAELLDEFVRIEEQVGGPIAARMGKLVEELAGRGVGEAVQGQRGPREGAAEMLELLAGVGGEGHIRMEARMQRLGIRRPAPPGATARS